MGFALVQPAAELPLFVAVTVLVQAVEQGFAGRRLGHKRGVIRHMDQGNFGVYDAAHHVFGFRFGQDAKQPAVEHHHGRAFCGVPMAVQGVAKSFQNHTQSVL